MTTSPIVLALDTATNHCSVALFDGTSIRAFVEDAEMGKQAERLVLLVERALSEANLSYSNITLVATTTGPGSFTGIRICLATARAIAMASNIPCMGLTTLETFAEAAAPQRPVLVVLNAGKGQVYAQLFGNTQNLTPLSEAVMLDPEKIRMVINNQEIDIVGNAQTMISPFIDTTRQHILDGNSTPDARALARLAARRFNPAMPPATPAALYIRPPDAKLPEKGKIK